MPNIKSAIKRARQSEVRRIRNAAQRSALRTAVKAVDKAIVAGKDLDTTKSSFLLAQKKLDQAVSKGILHRNAAARKKSRLARKMNAWTRSSSS